MPSPEQFINDRSSQPDFLTDMFSYEYSGRYDRVYINIYVCCLIPKTPSKNVFEQPPETVATRSLDRGASRVNFVGEMAIVKLPVSTIEARISGCARESLPGITWADPTPSLCDIVD